MIATAKNSLAESNSPCVHVCYRVGKPMQNIYLKVIVSVKNMLLCGMHVCERLLLKGEVVEMLIFCLLMVLDD